MEALNLQCEHNYLFLKKRSYMIQLKYVTDYEKKRKNSQFSFSFLINLVTATCFSRNK